MHQQLKLSEHLKFEKKELQHLTCEIRDLEMKVDRRQLQLRGKLTVRCHEYIYLLKGLKWHNLNRQRFYIITDLNLTI